MVGLRGTTERPWVAFVDQAPGLRGELSASGFIELVQVIAITTPTGALHVEAPAGTGTVWFENGAVVHACFEQERGAVAFQRMLHWQCGRFRVDAATSAPERTIDASTTQLVLESARILDEESASSGRDCEQERAAE